MKQFPVIYSKEPRGCMEKAKSLGLTPATAILLHQGNKSQWHELLSRGEIDCTQVYGIDPIVLSSFGAKISGMPEPFTEKELIYILSRKYKNQHEDIVEILSIVRKKHASQSDINVFNSQVNEISKQICNGE